MCDLAQFIVSLVTSDVTATALAQLFMSDIVITFDIVSVEVIDDGSTFKYVFLPCAKYSALISSAYVGVIIKLAQSRDITASSIRHR